MYASPVHMGLSVTLCSSMTNYGWTMLQVCILQLMLLNVRVLLVVMLMMMLLAASVARERSLPRLWS